MLMQKGEIGNENSRQNLGLLHDFKKIYIGNGDRYPAPVDTDNPMLYTI